MAYRVEYAKGVTKDLKKLPVPLRARALNVVEQILAKDPRAGRLLTGPYKGLWKYRIGDYRIIYSIEQKTVTILILRIRHRRDVYQGIVS